jgi:hypothetical protein
MSFLYSQCECLQHFLEWRDPDSNRLPLLQLRVCLRTF